MYTCTRPPDTISYSVHPLNPPPPFAFILGGTLYIYVHVYTFTTAEKSSRKLKSPYMKSGSDSKHWPTVSEREVRVNSRALRRYDVYTEGD